MSIKPRATNSACSREELVGVKVWSFDTVIGESAFGQEMRKVSFGVRQVNTTHRRKDGSVFPVELRARSDLLGWRPRRHRHRA